MMASIKTLINWFEQRKGNVQYSIANRFGLYTYDCSSSLFYALRTAEYIPNNLMGNTDDIFLVLESNGFSITTEPVRGDIFVWGKRGSASGSGGHCGVYTDEETVISCNSYHGGITENSYSTLYRNYGSPPVTIYHNPDETDDSTNIYANIGELENLSIKDGSIVADGWHYTTGYETEIIVLINAITDEELYRSVAMPVTREDLKEEYQDASGIENSGFSISASVQNGTSVYVKGIRTNGEYSDEIIFPTIITYEQAYDVAVNLYAQTNRNFFFQINDGSKVVARGKEMLSNISFDNELMYIPTMNISLPISYIDYISGNEEILIYINNKVFHGYVSSHEVDKVNEIINISLTHVIGEWEFRQISTNLACKNRTVNDIYSTLDFRYTGWNVDFLQDSAGRIIDYVYSRQSKLDGLTKTCELTQDLFWRAGFSFGRKLEIGTFGETSKYIVSAKSSGWRNIRMISEPVITHNYESVINIATVYGEKSDSGMSSMSLREIYEDTAAQYDNFPVVILKNGINNERNYDYVEYSKLAPNNDIEYSVLDIESIALESGIVKEGSFSFNDIAPFNIDSDEITDEDRYVCSKTAYDAAVKKLKESRRSESIQFQVEEIPYDLNVGDKIRFFYENMNYILGECSNYMKKIMTINDYFFITRISYEIDENGTEINTLTIEKELRVIRETDAQ